MALIQCPDCGQDVSDSAAACPRCGAPTGPLHWMRPEARRTLGKRSRLWPLAVGLLVAAVVSGGWLRGKGASEAVSSMPVLRIDAFRWSRTSDMYVTAEGQVTNIGAEPLQSVRAVVTYRDASGGFVTSDAAGIDFNPVLPEQTSPYSVTTRWNPAMATAQVEFGHLFGGKIPSRDATAR